MPGRVLIVDDESDITDSIKAGLEHFEFQIETYNDPLVALSNFKAKKYEVVILDIRMPKLNGFELYREMRKIDGEASYCFLTAFDIYGNEFAKIFPDTGVKTFLKKPISITQLAARLNETIAQRQQITTN
jgi:two-component system, OmpR family, response regulator ChvI